MGAGEPLMEIRTAIEIDAPAHDVWSILVNLEQYEEWNPLTVAAVGELVVGAPIRLYVKLGFLRMVRTHVISRIAIDAALCWRISNPLTWLIRGERCQTVEALAENRCRYRNVERIDGILSPIIKVLFGHSIRKALESVGVSLKHRAENPCSVRANVLS